ncbi:MAG: triose-phosphate isomerase [Planctomycetes bacterium]|nr:triose-phosphate isomerase [Planctomycetota bacterium]
MSRRPFIAGNWKMNLDLASARALIADIRARIAGQPPIDIAVCPPSIYFFPTAKALADSPIAMGAQNCHHEKAAFTGEVSPAMVRRRAASMSSLAIERRHTIGPKDAAGHVHGESDEMVALKVRAVLDAGLVPIVCVGETLDERDANKTEAVLTRQIHGSLAGLDSAAAAQLVVAYEPVWAIGTGRNATPQQAQDAHAHIRNVLAEKFGRSIADGIRIQYGGSVKPDNALTLLSCPDVDGALVGGASLKAGDFVAIIEAGIKAKS